MQGGVGRVEYTGRKRFVGIFCFCFCFVEGRFWLKKKKGS